MCSLLPCGFFHFFGNRAHKLSWIQSWLHASNTLNYCWCVSCLMPDLMQEQCVNLCNDKGVPIVLSYWVINDVHVFFLGKSAVKGNQPKNKPEATENKTGTQRTHEDRGTGTRTLWAQDENRRTQTWIHNGLWMNETEVLTEKGMENRHDLCGYTVNITQEISWTKNLGPWQWLGLWVLRQYLMGYISFIPK